MTLVIIDYGSGNLHSAKKAFEFASAQSNAREAIELSSDPDVVGNADRIVLPGVGSFADCKAGLQAHAGLIEALEHAVIKRGVPFLGICVGMQLMAAQGNEHSPTPGLGWIDGDVVPVAPKDPSLKIPHMGWNTLAPTSSHPLFQNIALGDRGLHAYFVHSFHMQPNSRSMTLAEADYGGPITAMVGRDNMVGTQFHPEKSQKLGLAFITNFLGWRP